LVRCSGNSAENSAEHGTRNEHRPYVHVNSNLPPQRNSGFRVWTGGEGSMFKFLRETPQAPENDISTLNVYDMTCLIQPKSRSGCDNETSPKSPDTSEASYDGNGLC